MQHLKFHNNMERVVHMHICEMAPRSWINCVALSNKVSPPWPVKVSNWLKAWQSGSAQSKPYFYLILKINTLIVFWIRKYFSPLINKLESDRPELREIRFCRTGLIIVVDTPNAKLGKFSISIFLFFKLCFKERICLENIFKRLNIWEISSFGGSRSAECCVKFDITLSWRI